MMKPTLPPADRPGSADPLPLPAAVAADRVERLRARIQNGDYAIDPWLIAQAIRATEDPAVPTRNGVNFLTLQPVTVSVR